MGSPLEKVRTRKMTERVYAYLICKMNFGPVYISS